MKRILSICLLAALALLSSCGNRQENKTKAPIRVKTEITGTSSEAVAKTYVGVVEENEATAVSFTGMGVVKRVLVKEGQAVNKGDLLAEMDDTQARSLLDAAKATKDQADDALARYTKLHNAGSLSEAQWVEIQSKVAQAESQYRMAKKNLEDCRLTAPCRGIIGHKYVGAGETAMPSQAIVTIFDISEIVVKVAIPEKEMNSIKATTPTQISVVAADKTVRGGHIEKGVSADALTHTYEVRIHAANAGGSLLPGMVANVIFGHDDNTGITLPVSCVQKRTDASLFVWKIDENNAARRTEVKIGAPAGNRVIIAGGLSEGDRIVTEGWQKLSEGTIVIY